jgi:hypothetical protein
LHQALGVKTALDEGEIVPVIVFEALSDGGVLIAEFGDGS